MYSYGPPHMAKQKQDDQLELIYSSYVRTQDVTLKTCKRRWIIGRSGKRGSEISVLAARHYDDDDDMFCLKRCCDLRSLNYYYIFETLEKTLELGCSSSYSIQTYCLFLFKIFLVWFGLVWFYGILTIVGYLTSNPFYTVTWSPTEKIEIRFLLSSCLN